MDSEVTRCSEVLATFFTAVRFLSCVNALMDFQRKLRQESFPALITAMRFLSCVNALVGF